MCLSYYLMSCWLDLEQGVLPGLVFLDLVLAGLGILDFFSGGSKGAQRTSHPSRSKSLYFHAVFVKIWSSSILASPHLGNPGSVTAVVAWGLDRARVRTCPVALWDRFPVHREVGIMVDRHAIENFNLLHLLIPMVLRAKCDRQSYKHSLQFNNNSR